MPNAGRIRSTKVALLTIIDEEFEITREIFGLSQRIGVSEYFAKAEKADGQYEVVLRRASDRGNLPAEEAIMELVEDFFPSYTLIVGIAGGASAADLDTWLANGTVHL